MPSKSHSATPKALHKLAHVQLDPGQRDVPAYGTQPCRPQAGAAATDPDQVRVCGRRPAARAAEIRFPRLPRRPVPFPQNVLASRSGLVQAVAMLATRRASPDGEVKHLHWRVLEMTAQLCGGKEHAGQNPAGIRLGGLPLPGAVHPCAPSWPTRLALALMLALHPWSQPRPRPGRLPRVTAQPWPNVRASAGARPERASANDVSSRSRTSCSSYRPGRYALALNRGSLKAIDSSKMSAASNSRSASGVQGLLGGVELVLPRSRSTTN